MDALEMWGSDYGQMAMPPSARRRLEDVRRRKDGNLDFRFKKARDVKRVLDALLMRRYLRG